MPPKSKKAGNNSQAKLKYINSCVQSMINSLPRQTFNQMVPISVPMQEEYSLISDAVPSSSSSNKRRVNKSELVPPPSKKRKKASPDETGNSDHNPSCAGVLSSSTQPIVLNRSLNNDIPRHPNVFMECAYCHQVIHSYALQYYIEQPQARRRFTPLCNLCFEKKSND